MLLRILPAALATTVMASCSPSADAAQGPASIIKTTRTAELDRALSDQALAEAAALSRLNSILVARDGRMLAGRSRDGRGLTD